VIVRLTRLNAILIKKHKRISLTLIKVWPENKVVEIKAKIIFSSSVMAQILTAASIKMTAFYDIAP
jgi:hypothetical protein